jgi:hypothetical protein
MAETEIIEHDLTIRLRKDGKLPAKISCSLCGGPMHRQFWVLRKPTYHCRHCEATTSFDMPAQCKKAARGPR